MSASRRHNSRPERRSDSAAKARPTGGAGGATSPSNYSPRGAATESSDRFSERSSTWHRVGVGPADGAPLQADGVVVAQGRPDQVAQGRGLPLSQRANTPATPPPNEPGPPRARQSAEEQSGTALYSRRRILLSSLANSVRTLATFVIGFLVPPFLIQWIPRDDYNAFLVSSRIGALLVILDLGMQFSVTRLASKALAEGDTDLANQVISAAVHLFRRMALIGSLLLIALTISLPYVFTDIPAQTVSAARWCVVLFGFSSLVSLTLSPFGGLLVATNLTPSVMWQTVALRVASAVGMLFVAKSGYSIVMLGVVSAVAAILIAALPVVVTRRRFNWLHLLPHAELKQTRGLLVREAGVLSIISMTQFLLNNIDVQIVGKVDFNHLVVFSNCIAIITGLETIHTGLMQPMLPALSAARATKTRREFATQFRMSTRLVAALWASMVVGTFIIAPFLMRLWLRNPQLAEDTTPVLRIILLGYFFRYGDWVFGVAVVAAGQFRRIIAGPIVGSIIHVILTVGFGARYGVRGVAGAAVAASIATMVFARVYSMPRVRDILPVKPRAYFFDTMFVPCVVSAPVLVAASLLPGRGTVGFGAAMVLAAVGVPLIVMATLQLPMSQIRNPRQLLVMMRN